MDEEQKEKLLSIAILVLGVVVLILVARVMMNRSPRGLEVERLELVGDKEQEEERTPPKRELVEYEPEFGREKDQEMLEIKDWDNSPRAKEGGEIKDTTKRYEVGDIVEDFGELLKPEREKIEEENKEEPIDYLDLRYDIHFRGMDGKLVKKEDIPKGKPTVIMVWSEHYPESLEALKGWEKVYQKEKDNYNFIFLNRAFGYKEDIEGVKEYTEREGIDLPIYMDIGMMFQSKRVAGDGYPTTYYITKDLDIHQEVKGKQSDKEKEASLEGIPERLAVRLEMDKRVAEGMGSRESEGVDKFEPKIASPSGQTRPNVESPQIKPIPALPTKPVPTLPALPTKPVPTLPALPTKPVPTVPTKPVPTVPKPAEPKPAEPKPAEPIKPTPKPPQEIVDPERPAGI